MTDNLQDKLTHWLNLQHDIPANFTGELTFSRTYRQRFTYTQQQLIQLLIEYEGDIWEVEGHIMREILDTLADCEEIDDDNKDVWHMVDLADFLHQAQMTYNQFTGKIDE